eukprot:m.179848 g.179848  ORF g.179848 m.179848 type:complete len:1076 (+) comp17417_c0_seq2:281-3508(+)
MTITSASRFALLLLLLLLTALLPTMHASSASGKHWGGKCGTSLTYWSESCGAIGSKAARYCSNGGVLVNPDSCVSHFEGASRGCGLFLMGCQSLCRVTELPCQLGVVRFARETSSVCVHPQHDVVNARFVASRVSGRDGMLEAAFTILWNDEELHQGRLEWPDQDVSPKVMDVPLELRSRQDWTHANITCRLDVAASIDNSGSSNGNNNNTPVVTPAYAVHATYVLTLSDKCAPPSAGEISAARSHYEVREDARHVDIIVNRRSGGAGNASVEVVYVGGTAIPHINFIPPSRSSHRLLWEDGQHGPRSFRLQLREHVGHEAALKTAYFMLANAQGAMLSTHNSVVSLAMRNSPATHPPSASPPSSSSSTSGSAAAAPAAAPAANSLPLSPVLPGTSSSSPSAPQATDEFLAERLRVLPFASQISDRLVQERFLRSWLQVPLRQGEVFVHEGHVPMFVSVVLRGTARFFCECRYKEHLKDLRLDAGTIIGASPALALHASQLSAMAETDMELLVMPVHTLRLHASLVKEISILDVMRRASFKSIIKNSAKKHPVVLFPGFMSSRLSAWKTKACTGMNIEVMEPLWISIERIMQTISVDKNCWLGCLSLGPNQTDHEECKIRPREGISAVSELYPGPFRGPTTIFRSVIEYLATEWGYDANSIVAMPYDWRLSPDKMEERDAFFTKAKTSIEIATQHHGLPTVFISHSLGGMVVNYFFEWLKRTDPNWEAWCQKHVQASIGLGIPLLGSFNTLYALLHGDTMGLPITAHQAREFGVTFGSALWMMPVPDNAEPVPPSQRSIRFRKDHAANPNATGWSGVSCSLRVDEHTERSYTIAEVYNGQIFDDVVNVAKDELSHHIVKSHKHYFEAAGFNPLGAAPKRPPIESVVMIYGVDRPTRSSIVFRKREGDNLHAEDWTLEAPGGVVTTSNGTVLGQTPMARSGDGSVQYASLSWAHTWHVSEDIAHTATEAQEVEFYDHLLGQWGEKKVFSLLNTVQPASSRYESVSGKNHNVVIEIDGQEHRDTVRNPFVVKTLLEKELLNIWGRSSGLTRHKPAEMLLDGQCDNALVFYDIGLQND